MAILSKGKDFDTGEQVTAAKLDNLVDNAIFASGAADNVTTQINGLGAIIVKDDGIGVSKLEDAFFNSGTGALTLDGTAPSVTFNDSDNSGTSPVISSDNTDGDLSIIAGKANAEVIVQTGNDVGTATTRLQAGELVSKNNAGSADEGIKVTGSIYATVDIVADGDVVADLDSDERLKDNINPILEPIQKVNQLSGNTFTWNEKSSKVGEDVGVIAQEVQKLFPSAVREKENGYLKVDYVRLVPVLIEAIKELSSKVEKLESK